MTVLLLDAMGTLVREPFHRDVPAFFQTSLDQLVPLLSFEAWVDFESNRIDETGFAQRFFRDRREYDHAGLVRALVESYAYLDGMEALLADLAACGAPMHILSNYPCWYRLIEDKLHVSRYAPWTFVSCETGLRKPDPETFASAARALGAPPSECLLIDDRAENCAGARSIGMEAIEFTGATPLRAALIDRGLLERR